MSDDDADGLSRSSKVGDFSDNLMHVPLCNFLLAGRNLHCLRDIASFVLQSPAWLYRLNLRRAN